MNTGDKSRRSKPVPSQAKPASENHEPMARPEAKAKFPLKDGIDSKAAAGAINLFTANDNDSHLGYTSRAYAKVTTAMYRYLCDLIEVDHTTVQGNQRAVKKPMFDLLVQSVRLIIVCCLLPCKY